MRESESYLFDLLNKQSKVGKWVFFELKPVNGKTVPQSKKYPDLDFWVAYPDFEYYLEDKLSLLVEVKGYSGFFNGRKNSVAMKLKHYKGYRVVQEQEGVDVRICFVIDMGRAKKIVFWETLSEIEKFNNYIEYRTHSEVDYVTGEMVEKREKYIFWDVEDFRTDEENITKI